MIRKTLEESSSCLDDPEGKGGVRFNDQSLAEVSRRARQSSPAAFHAAWKKVCIAKKFDA